MTDILDETEVAALLACEPSTVQTMAREGELPAVKFGKHWRFPRAALLGGGATALGGFGALHHCAPDGWRLSSMSRI